MEPNNAPMPEETTSSELSESEITSVAERSLRTKVVSVIIVSFLAILALVVVMFLLHGQLGKKDSKYDASTEVTTSPTNDQSELEKLRNLPEIPEDDAEPLPLQAEGELFDDFEELRTLQIEDVDEPVTEDEGVSLDALRNLPEIPVEEESL